MEPPPVVAIDFRGPLKQSLGTVAQLTVVAEHPAAMPQPQQNPPLTLKLKRSASGVQRLTTATTTTTKSDSVSPPAPQQLQSVHAARRNVQSTAELVAQLSEALPQDIGIDLGTTAASKMETVSGVNDVMTND